MVSRMMTMRRSFAGIAILSEIARRPDCQIDGAVDLAEPGAAIAFPGNIDDGEKLQRSCPRRNPRDHRRTTLTVPFRRPACAQGGAIFPSRPHPAARMRTGRTVRRIS